MTLEKIKIVIKKRETTSNNKAYFNNKLIYLSEFCISLVISSILYSLNAIIIVNNTRKRKIL